MMLKSSFGCFSLQTGTVAIGAISLVWSILSAISAFPILDEIENGFEGSTQCVVKIFFTGVLIYVIVVGLVDSLMIYGAIKRNPVYVFPWLTVVTTDLLVCTSMSLGCIVSVAMILPIQWFFIVLAICTISIAIHTYVWLIVYSFYSQLIVEKYGDAMIPITKDENLDQLKNVYHNV